MYDRLPPKGMCSGSRELFKFREISYNISETAHDRLQLGLGLWFGLGGFRGNVREGKCPGGMSNTRVNSCNDK